MPSVHHSLEAMLRSFRRQGQVIFFHKLITSAKTRCWSRAATIGASHPEGYQKLGQEGLRWRDLATRVLADGSIREIP